MFPLDAPAAVVFVVATALALGVALGGQWLVHRAFAGHDFAGHNDVGGYVISVAGTIYAVLLGFLTVVAWQHFADTRALVAQESAAATDAWHAAVDLPASRRSRVREDVQRYARTMVTSEWPRMRAGGFAPDADGTLMDAMEAAGTAKTVDAGQANSQAQTMAELTTMHDTRQRRLDDNVSDVSWFEWLVLFVGATSVIVCCWLFGLSDRGVHLMMTGVVTVIMVASLVLLFELQFPFRTALRIDAGDWEQTVRHFQLMQTTNHSRMRM